MEKPCAAFLRHGEAVDDSDQEKQGEKPPEKKGGDHWLKGVEREPVRACRNPNPYPQE